jgi:hypothetical protein
MVETMAQVPEEPPSEHLGIRDEPAGKKRYLGGVLTWRKSTRPVLVPSPVISGDRAGRSFV